MGKKGAGWRGCASRFKGYEVCVCVCVCVCLSLALSRPLSLTHIHTLPHCRTLPHTATHCHTLQHTATHCNTLQHNTTHCNTIQHTATHCNSHYSVMNEAGQDKILRCAALLLHSCGPTSKAIIATDSVDTRLAAREALGKRLLLHNGTIAYSGNRSSVLQCVAVCCSVPQCAAVCCSVL